MSGTFYDNIEVCVTRLATQKVSKPLLVTDNQLQLHMGISSSFPYRHTQPLLYTLYVFNIVLHAGTVWGCQTNFTA